MSFLDSPVMAGAAMERQRFIPGTELPPHGVAKTLRRTGAHQPAGAAFQARVAVWIFSGTNS